MIFVGNFFLLRETEEFDGMFENINLLKNMCQSGQVTTSKNHNKLIPLPLPPCALQVHCLKGG
jgi:hypothetical protein